MKSPHWHQVGKNQTNDFNREEKEKGGYALRDHFLSALPKVLAIDEHAIVTAPL